MPVNPGKLNVKLTLERLSNAQDAMGGESGTWATAAQFWAHRFDITNRETWEVEESMREQAQFMTRWTIRKYAALDIRPEDRINDGSKYHQIITTREHGRQDLVEILTYHKFGDNSVEPEPVTAGALDFSTEDNSFFLGVI